MVSCIEAPARALVIFTACPAEYVPPLGSTVESGTSIVCARGRRARCVVDVDAFTFSLGVVVRVNNAV
jgi:hypothetical protein